MEQLSIVLKFIRPQEIIVFVIGGITYEESYAIHTINRAFAGNLKVLIGGTCVHNFRTFIDEVLAMGGSLSIVNEIGNRESKYSTASSLRN